MTTVGIIGGLGPESTVDYYRRILEAWERDDPSTAPSIVIDSLDVQLALRLVESDRAALTEYLLASLRRLAGAGVDFAVMAANTPHIVFDDLAARSPMPLLSIVEVCAQEAQRRGLGRLGLLGTRFTMEGAFYAEVCARYGIVVVPPNGADRAWVHERYVGELLRGEFRDDTRRQFMALVSRLRDEQSIDGVILGGTELPLLLSTPIIADVPALDTTALHVAAIVKRLRQTGTLASTTNPLPAGVILLPPGDGRHYPCGPMQSLFLADGEETGDRYSVSIWYVDPGKPGPGGHSHVANEELFYVIEGTMTFLVGDEHVDATAGTFLRIPAGVMHDFENRTARRAGVLNVFIPGGFESNMPAIVEWYRAQAQPKTDTKRR